MLRRLAFADMDDAARIFRISFDSALPTLKALHTPDEDLAFFRERLFAVCEMWGAFADGALAGFVAFREGWIDQLYVLPRFQGQGIGSSLLQVPQAAFDSLQLWTFQRNLPARRFYEAHGFCLVRETDGSDNEEKEPDALYQWRRDGASLFPSPELP